MLHQKMVTLEYLFMTVSQIFGTEHAQAHMVAEKARTHAGEEISKYNASEYEETRSPSKTFVSQLCDPAKSVGPQGCW